jgi:uncharacterized protein (TIGR03085 family)
VTDHASAERAGVCDLLDSLGPDAPTLCEGWTTYDLAAHLAIRDRVPAAWPGIALRRFADRTERIQRGFTAEHPFADCVAMIRRGAPAWSPMGAPVLAGLTNLLEYVVHHEDIRRAQPGWGPRAVPATLTDAIWSQLRLAARPAFRRAPDGVQLLRAGSDATISAKRGPLIVTIEGDPVELLLYAFNRRAVARVEVRGDDAAVARLAAARIGL